MEKEEAGPLFCEAYTGTTTERSKWQLLLAAKTEGDTLAVTQLDRIVRTARQGLELIDTLNSKSVSVRILNMWESMDKSSIGRLMRAMRFAFAAIEVFPMRNVRFMTVLRRRSGTRTWPTRRLSGPRRLRTTWCWLRSRSRKRNSVYGFADQNAGIEWIHRENLFSS